MTNGTAVATRKETEGVLKQAEEGGAIGAFASEANFEAAQRMAIALTKSSLVPKEYQGNVPNCLIAMELANRTGASVFMVMQNLDIIHGRPAWRSQFLIATVNASGRFSPLRFRFEGTEGEDDWGCRAVAVDKEAGEECVGALITIGLAKAEGWHGKSGSKWKTMPEQMLMYRAGGFWTRVYCPEIGLGMYTADEVEDIGPRPDDRVKDLAAALDGEDIPLATVVEDPEPPAEEEDAPATSGEIDQLKNLIDKCDVEIDEAERLHGLIDNEDGPGVRTAIKDLQKRAIGIGAQGGLDV
ncbi:MAG: hypothetical protein V3T08_09235 [Gemmatimonadota bacterium]